MVTGAKYSYPAIRALIIASLFIFLCNSPAYNQNYNFSFDHLTVEEGLSQSTIFAITQDTKGFIGEATRDGLNRYASREVKAYKNNPQDPTRITSNVENIPGDPLSLSGSNVNSIFEDRKKDIWVGTRNGLDLLVGGETSKVIRFFHNDKNPQTLADNYVRTLYQNKTGDIWVGTFNGLSKDI